MKAVGKALGGPLGTATSQDPDAGGLEKLGGKVGAGIGRAMGAVTKGIGRLAGGSNTPAQPNPNDTNNDGKDDKTGKPVTPTTPGGGQQPGKPKPTTPAVDTNKDGVDDKTGAEVDADGDGKNDVTKKPVKPGNRPQGGGRQKGGLSQTPGAIKKRQARADAKAQADANKDGKDDATGEPIQQQPATAGQPDDIQARKDAVAQSKAQRGAITSQDHQLIRNDLAALAQTKDPKIARRIADKLSAYKDQGTDVTDYANALNTTQKKAGIKGTQAKNARAMRQEAYQFMKNILESVNLTWQDIGYDVIMLEEQTEYVYLVPAGLQRIRELAGV